MECPRCGHEFDEEKKHQDADCKEEFEVVCEACEQEFWVQAQVTYVYRVGKTGGVAMRDLSKLVWGDLQTDRERAEFIQSGLAVETGILAQAMVEDLTEVYRRIDAAVKALQGMTRCEVYADDQFGMGDERSEHGEWVQWDDIEDVVLFLTGNSPTNLEGST